MFPYCYHTHTARCGHASGTDEEYVLAAIQGGIKRLGFSDHIFYPGLSSPTMRGEYSELEGYVSSINALKIKYAPQIEIHLGFESEYYPEFDSYYKHLLNDHVVEYLILGQHFLLDGHQIKYYFGDSRTPEVISEYAKALILGMKTGYYRYVAHPDLYMANYPFGFDETAKKIAHDICRTASELGMPLEINLGAIRFRGLFTLLGETRYAYPYEPFWEIAASYHIPVYIGIDAHHPLELCGDEYKIALAIIEKYKLKHLKTFKF